MPQVCVLGDIGSVLSHHLRFTVFRGVLRCLTLITISLAIAVIGDDTLRFSRLIFASHCRLRSY